MSSIVRMLARARTQGAKRPTPTQSTCLYYDHDNEASKCVYKHEYYSCFNNYFKYSSTLSFLLNGFGFTVLDHNTTVKSKLVNQH